MTFSFSASSPVQLRGQRGQAALFGSTACAAAFALRPLPPARKRICASESWISLARRSLPTLPPPMSIGVAAPVLEAGTIAARSEAWSTKNPALAARAPLGATNPITGIGERSSACVISRMDVSRPPGVSSSSTTASSCALAAARISSTTQSAVTGSTSASSTTTRTCGVSAAAPGVSARPAMRATARRHSPRIGDRSVHPSTAAGGTRKPAAKPQW